MSSQFSKLWYDVSFWFIEFIFSGQFCCSNRFLLCETLHSSKLAVDYPKLIQDRFPRQFVWPYGSKYRTMIFLCKLTKPFTVLVRGEAELRTKNYILSWKRYGALRYRMLLHIPVVCFLLDMLFTATESCQKLSYFIFYYKMYVSFIEGMYSGLRNTVTNHFDEFQCFSGTLLWLRGRGC